ncbi:hypothetical protein HMPREF9970_2726 [Lachnoanaerobaculum saburreum F0468]|uniref:RNA-binding protein n=1 Tax=Lachnoanaerobaculum saburreum F0468 TaxID=1095750 RepID=I0R8L3_9FIRM|nr:hypothetical protein [Lachnoanaerobaculum saburreum]EIC96021.1 hypothetical protein HMPREF9970_2726 [Lachnoanaerobaculum saburreum F0468]
MINTGDIVISIKGHDRGEYYLVLDCDKDFVYLADGRLKLIEKPKKKNKKHVSRLGKSKEFIDMKDNDDNFNDVKLKYLLKNWRSKCLNQTL